MLCLTVSWAGWSSRRRKRRLEGQRGASSQLDLGKSGSSARGERTESGTYIIHDLGRKRPAVLSARLWRLLWTCCAAPIMYCVYCYQLFTAIAMATTIVTTATTMKRATTTTATIAATRDQHQQHQPTLRQQPNQQNHHKQHHTSKTS